MYTEYYRVLKATVVLMVLVVIMVNQEKMDVMDLKETKVTKVILVPEDQVEVALLDLDQLDLKEKWEIKEEK